jgi:hypothetical protein
VARVLTRLTDAAARLDRAARPRVLTPLARLDDAVLARLGPDAARTARAVLRALALLALAAGLASLAVLSGGVRAGGAVLRAVTVRADRLADAVAELLMPPPARVRHARTAGTGSAAREIALCAGVVLLAGVAALGSTAPAPTPVTAVQAAAESQDRPGAWTVPDADPGVARTEARAVPDLAISPPPAVVAPAPVAPPPAPAVAAPSAPSVPAPRWLPTGTGMWLHDWTRSEGGNAAAVVARAQASGFSHLYVQTGSTKKGWIGEEVLSQLLPATAGTGIKVIAWDFPKLIDPEVDAQRMVDAATWSRPGVPRVAAVAPDVETAAEGTRLSPDAVTRYYAHLRAHLPPEIAVLATVPWPSEKRTGFYPYAETAAHSDAFVPMAYWYNRLPGVVTETSMLWLAQFGLPVMPVGQGYDGRIDAPYLPPDPDPAASVQAFVDAARRHGARSVSLWSWQTTGQPQWDVLARASSSVWP